VALIHRALHESRFLYYYAYIGIGLRLARCEDIIDGKGTSGVVLFGFGLEEGRLDGVDAMAALVSVNDALCDLCPAA